MMTNISVLPNFETAGNETDKTDETDETDFLAVSNDDFIKGIFGNIVGSERPIVVSFSGDPDKDRPGLWSGKHWIADKTPLADNSNNRAYPVVSQ